MIPYARQDVNEADIAAVEAVLRSDFLTQGPAVPRFEAAVCAAVGAPFAVAMSSATSALHVACAALDLGPGDIAWTSPITFVASANAARYCGAEVDFVDIDPRTFTICPERLEARLRRAKIAGKLPKVVIAVHMCGQSCDMEAIAGLAARYGFRVIEDAAHAIGGSFNGARIGSCAFSDITVFSFHPVKIVTAAEGGMAMTKDRDLARRMALLRNHGVTREHAEMTAPPMGPWCYEQITLGWNYRMTDLQAALGASQMDRLDAFVARRHEIADRYDRELQGLPVATPWRDPRGRSAFHLYVAQVDDPARRLPVFEAMRAAGVGVNVHYIPVHLQPYYRAMGFYPGQFRVAETYYARAISLPMYPALTDEEQSEVVTAFRAALGA